MSLLSWFRRKVIVEQAHPDFPKVNRILIDEGDGSKPQELYLSRNNLCSMAWVCQKFYEKERGKGPIKDVFITLDIPRGGMDGEDVTYTLKVPQWAKYKLYRAVIERALEVGWKGEVYHPAKTSWEALDEDIFSEIP